MPRATRPWTDSPAGVDGDVQSGRTLGRLVEELSKPSLENDRGEMVPYSPFVQLRKKRGLNAIAR